HCAVGKLSLLAAIVRISGFVPVTIRDFPLQPADETVIIVVGVKDAVADLDESGSDSRFASRALKVLLERIVGVVRRDKNIVKAGRTERSHWRGRQLSFGMVVGIEKTAERLNLFLEQVMLEVGKGVSPVLKLDGMSSQQRCIQKHATAHAIGEQS